MKSNFLTRNTLEMSLVVALCEGHDVDCITIMNNDYNQCADRYALFPFADNYVLFRCNNI